MESFWGTLKQELVHHRHYATRQQAMRDITEYIEIFYNRQRGGTSDGLMLEKNKGMTLFKLFLTSIGP
jgi:hypothetical protein